MILGEVTKLDEQHSVRTDEQQQKIEIAKKWGVETSSSPSLSGDSVAIPLRHGADVICESKFYIAQKEKEKRAQERRGLDVRRGAHCTWNCTESVRAS